MRTSQEKELVFQHWYGDKAVLLARSRWERMVSIEAAIGAAGTWADFRRRLPEGEFEKLPLWCANEGEYGYREAGRLHFVPADLVDEFASSADPVIDAEEPFEPTQISQYGDGDYPPWMDAITEAPVPEIVIEAFGMSASSRMSGSWIEIPLGDVERIKRMLEMAGYELCFEAGLDRQPIPSREGGQPESE